jgi:outer membrane protein OmpA-like peptidoglycan-associated protein
MKRERMSIGLRRGLVALLMLGPALVGAESPRIVIQRGMVLTGARQGDTVGKSRVDTEIVTTVSELDAEHVALTQAFVYSKKGAPNASVGGSLQGYVTRQADLLGGHKIHDGYCEGDAANLPGVTGWPLASAAIVQDLASTGTTKVSVVECHNALIGGLTHQLYRGSLAVVGKGTEPFRVLLDGARVEVPVYHVKGPLSLLGNEAAKQELWILAFPASPIVMRSAWQSEDPDDIAKHQDTATFQVVRIDAPDASEQQAVTALSAQLSAKTCRAELHGVYFDSDSAALLSASDGTLRDVAGLVKARADWTLTVEGHTDNTGTPEHNLDLSNRRAAAVKDALVARFGVPAARLATAGFGQTRPVEDNTTVEGRARNRRVELSRKCN